MSLNRNNGITHARAIDTSNRRVKQDRMNSGAGDQNPGYRFDTFSDYRSAMMQHHFEVVTTVDSNTKAPVNDGGYVEADSSFASGYKHGDGIDLKWVDYP